MSVSFRFDMSEKEAPLGPHTPLLRWQEAVYRYACLQIESVPHTQDWLSRGCVDLRIATLLERWEDFPFRISHRLQGTARPLLPSEWKLLARRLAGWRSALRRLQECGLPECLEHGGLDADHVCWTADGPGYRDWSQRCVTVPLYGFGSLVWAEDRCPWRSGTALTRLEWAYLSNWAAYVSMEKLAEALVLWRGLHELFVAERLGMELSACRARWQAASPERQQLNASHLQRLQAAYLARLRAFVAPYGDLPV